MRLGGDFLSQRVGDGHRRPAGVASVSGLVERMDQRSRTADRARLSIESSAKHRAARYTPPGIDDQLLWSWCTHRTPSSLGKCVNKSGSRSMSARWRVRNLARGRERLD